MLIVASGLAYFFALAMLTPVLPLYIKGELHGNGLTVGIGVGAFAVGAVLLRPYAGRLGDRAGRRWLVIGGALTVSISIACYGLVDSLVWLVFARFVTGIGEAAFFVGAATMITDLAPVERRGEAVSYWSIAVYGGLAFGPALGEFVLGDDRYVLTWIVASALALVAAIVGCTLTETDPNREPGRRRTSSARRNDVEATIDHPAAVRPGIVLMLSLIGLAGFSTFRVAVSRVTQAPPDDCRHRVSDLRRVHPPGPHLRCARLLNRLSPVARVHARCCSAGADSR